MLLWLQSFQWMEDYGGHLEFTLDHNNEHPCANRQNSQLQKLYKENELALLSVISLVSETYNEKTTI